MKYEKVYIDFYGGTHGHFLEYVVNRYLFRIESANFSPFINLGASHNRTQAYNEDKIADVGHYSFTDSLDLSGNNLVVQIFVDLFYPALYNSIMRAGEITLDIENLEIDTLSKLTHPKHGSIRELIVNELGVQENYPRYKLRNIFYAKFNEQIHGIDKMNSFKKYGCDAFVFPFSAFYDYNRFVENLGQLSVSVGNRHMKYDNTLYGLWEEFTKRNQGNKSYRKCEQIIDAIIGNKNIEVKCNLVEEAYINSYITKAFNLHSDLNCFVDPYPSNTVDIYNNIIHQMNCNLNDF